MPFYNRCGRVAGLRLLFPVIIRQAEALPEYCEMIAHVLFHNIPMFLYKRNWSACQNMSVFKKSDFFSKCC